MKTAPALSSFKVKIAVDTQILAYIVDNTYPTLTYFFKLLFSCDFVDVVSSRFVTYEFIEVRKQEHYLREIYRATNAAGGTMNFGSTLKYRKDWSAPECLYENCYIDVTKLVEEDLKKINDDFGIIYNESFDHQLWGIHQDIVLSSKVSKEDSLVILSSIFPDVDVKEDNLIFITNDNQFFTAFGSNQRMISLDEVFRNYLLKKPTLFSVKEIKLQNSRKIDLLTTVLPQTVEEFTKKLIIENILKQNTGRYIGKTKPCPARMKGKLLCFKLEANELHDNFYASILSKDLKFLYNHETVLKGFYNVGKIEIYPHVPGEDLDKRLICVELKNQDGSFLSQEDYDIITETGNLIFIHPDSNKD